MKVKLNIFKLMKMKTRKKLIRKYKTIITLLGSHLTDGLKKAFRRVTS